MHNKKQELKPIMVTNPFTDEVIDVLPFLELLSSFKPDAFIPQLAGIANNRPVIILANSITYQVIKNSKNANIVNRGSVIY